MGRNGGVCYDGSLAACGPRFSPMDHATFLQDLALVMIVAAIVTVVFRRLKQPVVLGYILAGVIIGPHTPGVLISNQHAIETLSELGIVFLMFSLGLEFSLRKLKEVGATAVVAATFEILLMIWAGYEVGRAFGWKEMDSVFLGAIVCISSTTIILKALQELGKAKEPFAGLIFGILIVEDILAVVMIALLSGFADQGTLQPAAIGYTLLRLSAFLGVLLVVGLIAVPRLLNYVAKFRSDEMLLITVVGLCFGVSLLAVKLEYSVALGAFLIGAIIAEARQIAKIEALTHPVRDLFSAVFFVSIGLLIDPVLLVKYAGPILIISLVVVVGQIVSCTFGTFIAGNDKATSLRVGMGLAQIGEFSFIIAAMGLTKGVTSDFLYPIAVAVSGVTTVLTPYLIRSADPLVRWLDRVMPRGLHDVLDTYTAWIGGLGAGNKNLAGQLLRKWSWQIGLNLLLVTGIFLATVAVRGKAFASWPAVPGGMEGVKLILWLVATILSLPMLIAVFRKFQAFAMLLSEMHVTNDRGGGNTLAIRQVVTAVIVTAGTAALLLFVLVLSSAILPSRKALLVALLCMIVIGLLLWRSSIRLHARAQGALRETFAQPPAPRHAQEPVVVPALFREAEVHSLLIEENSPAAGKLIGELRLRTKSGASIVGIERGDQNIINPGPDEELRPGDHALVLGSAGQLEKARELVAAVRGERRALGGEAAQS
ncbi:MAG: potassium transporter [Frankiales bacterium]|nr:potassium transporter [Frankiales bacterium]